MNKSWAFAGLGVAMTLAAALLLRAGNDTPSGANRPAIGVPAPASAIAAPPGPAPVTAPASSGPGAPAAADHAALPAPTNADAGIRAFGSEAQRLSTLDQRREALPAFLQAADATLTRVRGELAALEARGAPAAEIAAKAEQLRRLTEVRAQVLARNADITLAR